MINVPWDHWFGTSRHVLKEGDTIFDAKAKLGIPSLHSFMYMFITFLLFVDFAISIEKTKFPFFHAILISVGPIIVAFVMHWISKTEEPMSKHFLFPFHEESLTVFMLHQIIAILIVIMPVFHLALITLQ